jgi:hypothetical protein
LAIGDWLLAKTQTPQPQIHGTPGQVYADGIDSRGAAIFRELAAVSSFQTNKSKHPAPKSDLRPSAFIRGYAGFKVFQTTTVQSN